MTSQKRLRSKMRVFAIQRYPVILWAENEGSDHTARMLPAYAQTHDAAQI